MFMLCYTTCHIMFYNMSFYFMLYNMLCFVVYVMLCYICYIICNVVLRYITYYVFFLLRYIT